MKSNLPLLLLGLIAIVLFGYSEIMVKEAERNANAAEEAIQEAEENDLRAQQEADNAMKEVKRRERVVAKLVDLKEKLEACE